MKSLAAILALSAFTLVPVEGVAWISTPPSTFADGTFTGWKTIGDVRMIDVSYGANAFGGYAALLTTLAGAVPFSDVVAFLADNGLPMQTPWLTSPWSGAVGSAIITDDYVLTGYYEAQGLVLVNAPSEVNFERGAYITTTFGGGSIGQSFSNWVPSATEFAFQTERFGGPAGSGAETPIKLAYVVWEMDPTAPNAGIGLIVKTPDTGSSWTLFGSSAFVLFGFARANRRRSDHH